MAAKLPESGTLHIKIIDSEGRLDKAHILHISRLPLFGNWETHAGCDLQSINAYEASCEIQNFNSSQWNSSTHNYFKMKVYRADSSKRSLCFQKPNGNVDVSSEKVLVTKRTFRPHLMEVVIEDCEAVKP